MCIRDSLEGISKNRRLSYLLGLRHKSNQYLLNSLDTEAEYSPRFSDLQTFINYKLNTNWDISFLSNISSNQYQMIPQDRNTDFGTFNEALRLTIFFEGQELDKYQTYFGALSTKYNPNTKLKLELTASAFQTYEEENFDILGEYWLYQLDNNLGSDNFGDVAFDRGVGKFINHARNSLDPRVLNFSHKGNYSEKDKNINLLSVGSIIERKNYQYLIKELRFIDNVKLKIVGDTTRESKYYNKLQNIISNYGLEEKISFYSNISIRLLSQLYSQCDFYISVSKYEGFGMSLANALQQKKMIITFKTLTLMNTLKKDGIIYLNAVSYTHLTLPTSDLV